MSESMLRPDETAKREGPALDQHGIAELVGAVAVLRRASRRCGRARHRRRRPAAARNGFRRAGARRSGSRRRRRASFHARGVRVRRRRRRGPGRRPSAAASSARTTLVPMATMRPPSALARAMAAALRRGDAVGLVEGEPPVERRIARRGDSGGMRERGDTDAAPPPGGERAPVERKPRRGRLEGDRVGGDPRPDVPESQRCGNMRVLDRPPVPRESGEDGCALAEEPQAEKPRMAEKGFDLSPSSGPRTRRSPGARGGGGARSSVRVRWSPAPNATATNRVGSRKATQAASRTSIGSPLAPCVPRKLAGRVAASLATTRSPGPNRDASSERGRSCMPPSAPAARSLADRPAGRSAAIMACAPAGDAARRGSSAEDRLQDLRGGILGALETRRVGVGHRRRVQRRVHVAGIDREEAHAVLLRLFGPDRRQVAQSRLAGPIGAPARIGVDRSVARDVDHERASALRVRMPRARRTALWSGGTAPTRFTASACSRSSHSVSARSESGVGPRLDALLTRTSSPPRWPMICSAIG